MFDDVDSLDSTSCSAGGTSSSASSGSGTSTSSTWSTFPFQGDLDKELKPKVNPKLLLRAFYWFRWGAMYTFIFGWLLFGYKYVPPGPVLRRRDGGMTNRALWILFGGLLGTIMWFNVWFVIWPRQKKILGGMAARHAPPRRRQAGRHRAARPRASTPTPRARCCSA